MTPKSRTESLRYDVIEAIAPPFDHRGSPDDYRRLVIHEVKEALGGVEEDFSTIHPDLPEPDMLSALPAVEKVSRRIATAVRRKEDIVLFGDYDCDGVCSVTLMLDFLEQIVPAELLRWYIPSRFRDGYGLTQRSLERCFKTVSGPTLLITMDCGTNSIEEIKRLKRKTCGGHKIETIVIDHHPLRPVRDSHPAAALLNPNAQQSGIEVVDSLKDLCAAGLCYLLIRYLAEQAPFKSQVTPPGDRELILAGLATLVDVAPVRRINRALIKKAICLFSDYTVRWNSVPGMAKLFNEIASPSEQEEKRIRPETFSFLIGPCLNAPGRMDKADTVVKLLRFRHDKDCFGDKTQKKNNDRRLRSHVRRCKQLNGRRMSVQRRILQQARTQAMAQVHDLEEKRVILVAGRDWDIGVVGIVASRLCEEFARPVIVCGGVRPNRRKLGQRVDWKGSGRSVDGYDLGAQLEVARDKGLIVKGGGHAMAAGVEFTEAQRPELHRWLNNGSEACALSLQRKTRVATFAQDLEAGGWSQLYQGLIPFGNQNPYLPIILKDAELLEVTTRPSKFPNRKGKKLLVNAEGKFRAGPVGSPIVRVKWLANPIEVRSTWISLRRYTLELEIRTVHIRGKNKHYFSHLHTWPGEGESFAGGRLDIPKDILPTEAEPSTG